jgi:hypothetical protein
MTQQEFAKQGFRFGDKVSYKGIDYEICAIEFEEMLIAIDETGDPKNLSWKRCENVELIN